MLSPKSRELYQYMLEKGYTEEFADVITRNLNTDWTAGRMIGYLRHYKLLPMAEVADEMLAILSDRDRIIKKKEAEYYQSRINEIYQNGLGNDDEDEDY